MTLKKLVAVAVAVAGMTAGTLPAAGNEPEAAADRVCQDYNILRVRFYARNALANAEGKDKSLAHKVLNEANEDYFLKILRPGKDDDNIKEKARGPKEDEYLFIKPNAICDLQSGLDEYKALVERMKANG